MIAMIVFWTSCAIAGYAFAGYPLLVIGAARWFGRAPQYDAAQRPPAVTVVIAARNEAANIGARLRNLLRADYPAELLRIVVVDDGSDDGTAAAALAVDDPRVRVIALPRHVGKAAALNAAMAQVDSELTVFADARQRFARDAIAQLVAPFADPTIGVVGGELVLARNVDGELGVAGYGTYWRIERALRLAEAQLGWAHAASGAIYAIRTPLFAPLPAGLLLDDVYTPAQIVRRGLRVWIAREALACEPVGSDAGREFSRKVRTLTGNWQLVNALPWLLDPRRNPTWFAFVSHKLMRLVAPWALIAAFAAAAVGDGPVLQLAFWLQVLGYGVAGAALASPAVARQAPLAANAGSFVALVGAALLSLPLWLGHRDLTHLWKR